MSSKRRYVSASKKDECERKLRQTMTDADRSLIFDRPDLKLGTYLDGRLKDIRDTVRQRIPARALEALKSHRAR